MYRSTPVTMVEVADFGCIHCQSFHAETATPLKEQYVDTGDVQWVALPYALSTSTVPAAVSGICANEQGAYFEYANALFAIEPPTTRISAAGYRQAAEAVGLNIDEFTSCLSSGGHTATVNSNRDAARSVGVTGTPTFFVNGEVVNGAQPLSAFSQLFAQMLSGQ